MKLSLIDSMLTVLLFCESTRAFFMLEKEGILSSTGDENEDVANRFLIEKKQQIMKDYLSYGPPPRGGIRSLKGKGKLSKDCDMVYFGQPGEAPPVSFTSNGLTGSIAVYLIPDIEKPNEYELAGKSVTSIGFIPATPDEEAAGTFIPLVSPDGQAWNISDAVGTELISIDNESTQITTYNNIFGPTNGIIGTTGRYAGLTGYSFSVELEDEAEDLDLPFILGYLLCGEVIELPDL